MTNHDGGGQGGGPILPPQHVEAEQALLGGLLVDNEAWYEAADLVTADDFYRHDHTLVFRAMFRLQERSKQLDVWTVSDVLAADGALEQAGGNEYLMSLASNAVSAANVRAYADIVHEKAILRKLISASNEIRQAAYQPKGRSSREVLDVAEQRIFSIAEQGQRGQGARHVDGIIKDAMGRLHELMSSDSALTGISTGFTDLDSTTCGLQKGNLIIVAGRPSMGKTAFAMNLVEAALIGSEVPVLVFSMEMPAEDLLLRMISSLGMVDQGKLRRGDLSDRDWAGVEHAFTLLQGRPLYIDDTGGLSPMELRTAARRVAREHDGALGLIMVDYLQLMQVPGNNENRAAEISEISRSLKSLAKELNVPVVALSQLNRGLEKREDKRPVMSDLRESGAIEQDADVIMFVYRPEVYKKEDESLRGLAEVIIGKQRNGPIGSVDLVFRHSLTRFENR